MMENAAQAEPTREYIYENSLSLSILTLPTHTDKTRVEFYISSERGYVHIK